MAVTGLSSNPMGGNNMQTHWRQRLMCQDGKAIQDRQTKRGDPMDKGSTGMMEVYTLGDTRMTEGLKGRSMSCNEITLTHYSMSSMKTAGKRQRRKK